MVVGLTECNVISKSEPHHGMIFKLSMSTTPTHLLEGFEIERRSIPNGKLSHLIPRQTPSPIRCPLSTSVHQPYQHSLSNLLANEREEEQGVQRGWLTLATLIGLRSLFIDPCTKTSQMEETGLEAYAAGGRSFRVCCISTGYEREDQKKAELTLQRLDAPG